MWNFFKQAVKKDAALFFAHVTQDSCAAYQVVQAFLRAITKDFIGSRNIIQHIIINIDRFFAIGNYKDGIVTHYHLVKK